MQKRVKLNHVLRQRHIDYPNTWKKMLQNIVHASPIFNLGNLGSIVLIDQTLYLVINSNYTKGWKCIKPMVNIFEYFLMPQCWRLNHHQHQLNSLQSYTILFVTDYLQKLLQGANQSLFLNIIDLSMLGKLIISKHYIQYINGQHQWKYQFVVERVTLPRLLLTQNEQSQNNEKIAKKISLSLNKARSLSNQKEAGKSRVLKRTVSVTNLVQIEPKRISTQYSHEKRGQPLKKQIERSRLILKQQKIKTQSRQRSKTQASVINNSKKPSQTNKNAENSAILFKRSKSKQKIILQKNRVQTQKQTEKPKLKINRQKSFVPPERKIISISEVNGQKKLQQQTQSFIVRCTQNVLKLPSMRSIKQSHLNEFIHELSLIYQEKFDEIKKRRDNSQYFYSQKTKIWGNKLVISKNMAQSIKLLTAEDQYIFRQFYKIIEEYGNFFIELTKQYIINFEQHKELMTKLINKLNTRYSSLNLSVALTIQIGLCLHSFHQNLLKNMEQVLNKIQFQKTKLILLKIKSQQKFQLIEKQSLEAFESCLMIYEALMKRILPKYLHLQPHQLSKTTILCIRISCLLQKGKVEYQKNAAFFKTLQIKTLLSSTYKREKQAILLIRQLQTLKSNIQNEIGFRSEMIVQGVYLKMGVLKDNFMKEIQSKFHQIFNYFLSYYQKSVNELNLKLSSIVAINVDYLSDYKCRQYKQNIEEHYKAIVASLMLLIQHLLPLLKQIKIQDYLSNVYLFRERITTKFVTFDQKLDEYRKSSVQTIKILQVENKANKEIYQKLNQSLKKLVNSLSTEKMILQQKSTIQQLQRQFESYNTSNQKLAISMKENDMIYWQDDTYFINQMALLKKSLGFIEGKHYRQLVNTPINELKIEDFTNSFQEFSKFIGELYQNKLEKVFRPIYNHIHSNLLLIQIFLYNEYQVKDLEKLKQLGFDVQSEKSNKILTIIKRYQNIDKKRLQTIEEIYREARLNYFNHRYENNPHNLTLVKQKGEFNVYFIANIDELRTTLQNLSPVKNKPIIQKLQLLSKLYLQVVSFNKMISLISNYNFSNEMKDSITQQINNSYQKLLKMTVEVMSIRILKNKITEIKGKYMDMLFNQKCSIFPRYCLYSVQQIIQLSSWEDSKQTQKNVKILYEEIDNVQVTSQNIIKSLTLAKDHLQLQNPIDVASRQGQKSKAVLVGLDSFIKSSLNHSQFASVQIKILFWQIYFTQQVQLQFFSDGNSIQKLRGSLQVVVSQIASQIRYDIKLHHKSYEIAQLTFFISHIDKIKNICALTDYQWVSTIRCYDRAKTTKIQQNQKVFEYGFQPKKPQNINPAFQIETGITYGFKQSSSYYQQSAYILGKPFKAFKVLAQYGFQENYLNLMNIIKKYCFFLKIIVNQINFKKVNYFHKKIFQMTLRKEQILESQSLKMPIFFQYSNESILPSCFPQKIRSFRIPQIAYDLNLVIYLELNKIQSQIDKRGIDIGVLHKAIAYINQQKSLSLKKVLGFTSKLKQFLMNQEEKQNLYKFCFTHFIVNFQIQSEQLSLILKSLIKPSNNPKLQEFINQLKYNFHQFMSTQSKKHIIFYGQTSLKTRLMKQLAIVSFYKRYQIQSTLYRVEGVEEFLQLQRQESLKKYRFAIEDRTIWQIDPTYLGNCKLMYINELQQLSIQQVFKNKISALKIQGSYQILWKMFTIVHFSYAQVCQKVSVLGSMELAVRIFAKHISDFISELDKNEQATFQLVINKDLIRSFLMIIHELYYYLTPPSNRKKFVEKIRENSFLEDYKSEELSSITCKGLTCDKIINLIKKEKSIYSNLNYCQKEMMVIKKYLNYGEITVGIYNSPFQLKMAKMYINRFQERKINILFKDQYMHLFSNLKYRNIIYVIDDVNLAKKRKLTFFKSFVEEIEPEDMKYLLFSNNSRHQYAMKRHITVYFSQIEVEQVFKFQTKSGILEQIQHKSRQLWSKNFFLNKQQYVQFLLKTTAKLPSQSYRKYYARYLVYNKLSLVENSIKVIQTTQEYLSKQIEYSSLGLYLQPSATQQFFQLQLAKKMEKYLASQSTLNKIIAKQCYSKVLPYAFSDRIYVIVEEVFLLPILIATLSEKKFFRLKNSLFIQQLVEIIETMYYQDKEFYVIVEEPLASSQVWLQCYHLYLNHRDIVNYYEQLTEFTDELVSKEEFVYRKVNLNVDIKDKIQDLLHTKMKVIISVDEQNARLYNNSYIQKENVIFFNCRLDKLTKSRVIDSIAQKIVKNQKEPIRSIILPYKRLFIELVELELISLKKLEHFMLDVIDHAELQILDLQRRKEDNKEKYKLMQCVTNIKQHLKQEVSQEQTKVARAKNMLEEVMNSIVTYNKIETPEEMEQIYFQHLSKIRTNFFNLQEKNIIDIKHKKHQELYEQLKDVFLHECVIIYKDYVLLRVTPQCILQAIKQKDLSAKLLKLYQKYNHPQLQEFILFRYFKYMLNVVEEYQKLQFIQKFLLKEVNQINYFYLLDLSIELKNIYQVVMSQSETIFGKLKLIDAFKETLTNIYHIGFSHEELFKYYFFKRLTKIIRNHAVQQGQYPLQSLLKRQSDKFKQIQCRMDEHILDNFEKDYESFNRQIFKQQRSIMIYDPYWKMEKICDQMKIKVIYINSEKDLHRVYGYQFEMTVFCLRLTTVKSWKENRMLIDECLDIIQHKHSDLKENVIQKLVISINNKAILQQVNTRFPLLNLDFSLLKFHDLVKCLIRNKQHRFQEIKKSYKEVKAKLIKQIELMKNLDRSQMLLYIMTLQILLQDFRQKQGEMVSIVKSDFLSNQEEQKIQYVYKTIIKLSKIGQIPFNYTLRLVKRLNFKSLMRKLFVIKGQKEREEHLVKLLHLSRCEKISEEVEQCLLMSRYIVVFYQNFNKKIVKDLLKLQQGAKYQIRTIIEINEQQIEQFLYSKSTLNLKDLTSTREVIFLFVKPNEISKIGQLIEKCSVIWT